MDTIVLKFGGTSFKNLNHNPDILYHISNYIKKGLKPVVVVSAIGRQGDPYATDTLIQQLEEINPKIKPKIKDLIMSCGETISTSIIAHLLESNNIPSEPLMGFQAGIVTDEKFNSAEIISINTSTIKKHMDRGKVVVVAGFQGITKNNEITTLGRGGSDITAIALGGYLNAKRVDIFTNVPGVAFIDPIMVPKTKYINNISYRNMYILSSKGVKVIHPKAVELAERFNIPVRITSTYLNVPGTLISNEDGGEKIIGIAVNSLNDKSIFTILYDDKFSKNLFKRLNIFIAENNGNILEITYHNGEVALVVSNENAYNFANNLYNHLIK
ncbi:aspartate kinase [Tepidimicrobium xylanilyticum]|uniref:aspartate kinase n=1 Tax=Tepidimicrobium xylanilyticum TaxID=1123352 RepID=UPI00264AA815|nr:aspartate kinase [Tepidimicrobium xylanilyticum]GMG97623.1 aspartokinase [Tepidimicrobium xylanilyticum]